MPTGASPRLLFRIVLYAAHDALMQDKGFNGRRFAAEIAGAGIEVIIPPTRAQRQTMPKSLQRLIARLRNRVEANQPT